jgi:hypothetical protein
MTETRKISAILAADVVGFSRMGSKPRQGAIPVRADAGEVR